MKSKFTEGDIIYTKNKSNNSFNVYKLLRIEKWPDGSGVWHLLVYEPVETLPVKDEINQLKVSIYHVPIASFENEAELLSASKLIKEDLEGYYYYLKRNDFNRYAQETEQNVETLLNKANEFYKQAYYLSKDGKKTEALELYSDAIDIFPLFYEALDNKGFTLMELGRFKEAIEVFRESLHVNPTGFTAQFTLAECYFHLKEYDKAELEAKGAQKMKDDPIIHALLKEITARKH